MAEVVVWKNEPDEHDYPAAQAYLSLLLEQDIVDELVRQLRAAPVATGKAKDLLRSSGLALLAADNKHVAKDLHKVSAGVKLSPVLLIRGDARRGLPLQVADGYHRVCASYHLDEDLDIPFKMAMLPDGP